MSVGGGGVGMSPAASAAVAAIAGTAGGSSKDRSGRG
jgi:hypothetical protein